MRQSHTSRVTDAPAVNRSLLGGMTRKGLRARGRLEGSPLGTLADFHPSVQDAGKRLRRHYPDWLERRVNGESAGHMHR
jgi:hypothetical protein